MEALGKALLRFLDTVNRYTELVCCLMLVAMVLIIVVSVFFRYVLSSPISWSEEVALLLLVWFGMLSVATAVYRHSHMAITIIYARLSDTGQYWLNQVVQILIAVFALNVSINAGLLVEMVDVQVLSASGLPKGWLYLAPLIGGALMALNAAGNVFLDRFVNDSTS